jgi:hypothetical protein
MLLRLIPVFGGDGTTYGIIAMNDTGSDCMTVFDVDFAHLGNRQGYMGWTWPVTILDANGTNTIFQSILVQVMLIRDDDTPWSDWINEQAIVKPLIPGLLRLSGLGIRRDLYMGTAPGNHHLAVATTKGGLTSLL